MSEPVNRSDLVGVDFNKDGLIAFDVCPIYKVSKPEGKLYFAKFTTSTAAVYTPGSDVSVSAETAGVLPYETEINQDSALIPERLFNNDPATDIVMVEPYISAKKTSVYELIETKVAKAMLDADTATDISAAPLAGLKAAVAAMRKPLVIVSRAVLDQLKADDEIAAEWTRVATLYASANVPADQIEAFILGKIVGCDSVKIGDSAYWAATGITNKDCAIVISKVNPLADVNAEAQAIRYLGFDKASGGTVNEFYVQQYHDARAKSYRFDVASDGKPYVLNKSLIKILNVKAAG